MLGRLPGAVLNELSSDNLRRMNNFSWSAISFVVRKPFEEFQTVLRLQHDTTLVLILDLGPGRTNRKFKKLAKYPKIKPEFIP